MLKFVGELMGHKSMDSPDAAYAKAKQTLVAKSKRAKAVLEVVESNKHIVQLLISTSVGQDSAFQGAAILGQDDSIMLWDPMKQFPILVDVSEKQVENKFTKQMMPKTFAKLAPLPAELVLLHEFGHIAQYMGELPTYVTLFKAGDIAAIEADNLKRNEWPVSDDFGLAKRSTYLHYNGSATASKWSISS